jgi:hypothetical protein
MMYKFSTASVNIQGENELTVKTQNQINCDQNIKQYTMVSQWRILLKQPKSLEWSSLQILWYYTIAYNIITDR